MGVGLQNMPHISAWWALKSNISIWHVYVLRGMHARALYGMVKQKEKGAHEEGEGRHFGLYVCLVVLAGQGKTKRQDV